MPRIFFYDVREKPILIFLVISPMIGPHVYVIEERVLKPHNVGITLVVGYP